jgi:hypothetical protein
MRLGEVILQPFIDETVEPLKRRARTTEDPDRDGAGQDRAACGRAGRGFFCRAASLSGAWT